MSLRPPCFSISSRRGPFFRTGEDQLVVPPDQLVGPALELPAATIQRNSTPTKQGIVQLGLLRLLGARLVDLFDGLKGENDVADLAGLAAPDQLHLALVAEEEKAVLLRQRLVRLEEADDFLLLLLTQPQHLSIPLLQTRHIGAETVPGDHDHQRNFCQWHGLVGDRLGHQNHLLPGDRRLLC